MDIKRFLNWKWWLGGLLALAVLGMMLTYFYIDGELTKMYGGQVETADLAISDSRPDVFAITNVSVLSPNSDQFTAGQSVIIRNGLIESVLSELTDIQNMTVIDGRGQFLVPGYTDSHVHLWESENDLLLYLANGVTQIREMNGSPENLRWKKEIANGRLGPDMFVASPQIANFGKMTGWFAAWTQNKVNATSPKEFERAIERFETAGYDAIKVSSFLTSEDYKMLNDAAQESTLPMIGHYPVFGKLKDVWGSNQTELAHVEEIMKGFQHDYGYWQSNAIEDADAFLQYVATGADEVAIKLLENDISITTTMALINTLPKQMTNLQIMLDEADLDYANPGITEGTDMADRALGWLPEINRYRLSKGLQEQERLAQIKFFEVYAQALQIVFTALVEKGVPLMAGTDANVPVMVPGFSLHEELQTLKQAGLSNAQVLASTMTVPAKWSNTNTGQIAPGYKANLVLLRDDPLVDIGATRAIETVIIGGRILSRSDLDDLLKAVKTANDNSRSINIDHHRHD